MLKLISFIWEKRKYFIAVFTPFIVFCLLCIFFPLPGDKIEKPGSSTVYFKKGRLARAFLTKDDELMIRLNSAEIPDVVKKSFIAAEDKYFYYHPGVNLFSIIRAAYQNIKNRRIVSGASTITMQLARMIEPKSRTLFSKMIEAFRALQIEIKYTKKEILTHYLNHLPFGSNIIGIEAASRRYFNKPISKLNLADIATLTVIPRSPNLLNPWNGNIKLLRKFRNHSLKLMLDNGTISKEEYDIALTTKLKNREFYPLPFEIPHLSDYLYYVRGLRGRMNTSIKYGVQKSSERIINYFYDELLRYGSFKISVVVVDNRTNEIITAIGSPDYFDPDDGQLIGFNIKRSPGSLLKPFLYAMAIEKGLITSETLIKDVPIYFRGYEPKNYGGIYTGLSKARDALCDSLNIPALILLRKIGVGEFYDKLMELKIKPLKTKDKFGLPIILGAFETSLLEAVQAYNILANKGVYEKIGVLNNKKLNVKKTKVFREGSSYLISNILSNHRNTAVDDYIPYKIAWKTGTSFNYKDAWTVGYNPHYTVGVWVGKYKGSGSNLLVGQRVATPIMLRIFDFLMKDESFYWYEKTSDLLKIEVCSLSGMRPHEFCPGKKKVLVLKDKVPMEKCRYHQKFWVDDDGKVILSKDLKYKDTRAIQEAKVFTKFPPDVLSWLAKNKPEILNLPAYRKKDLKLVQKSSPIIKFPKTGQVFSLPDSSRSLEIDVVNKQNTEFLYVFIDDKFVKKFDNNRPVFVLPSEGQHEIYVMDDFGNISNSIIITVKN